MPPAQARSRLNPAFTAAVLASPIPNQELARQGMFAQPGHLSSLLHAVYVIPSLQTRQRLALVAHLVKFTGPLFLEEHPPATADAFSEEDVFGGPPEAA
jgi:hypothetical protein